MAPFGAAVVPDELRILAAIALDHHQRVSVAQHDANLQPIFHLTVPCDLHLLLPLSVVDEVSQRGAGAGKGELVFFDQPVEVLLCFF